VHIVPSTAFHAGDAGSNPAGDARKIQDLKRPFRHRDNKGSIPYITTPKNDRSGPFRGRDRSFSLTQGIWFCDAIVKMTIVESTLKVLSRPQRK